MEAEKCMHKNEMGVFCSQCGAFLKCNHGYEEGVFCTKCGEKIRETCTECGEMERIGRKFCQKKLDEAVGAFLERAEPVRKKITRRFFWLRVLSTFFLMAATLKIAIYLTAAKPLWLFLLSIFFFIVYFFGFSYSQKKEQAAKIRARKKIKKEFIKDFPRHAELLKQVEGVTWAAGTLFVGWKE